MPYERSYGELKVIEHPACIYLRSKAMYVTGEVQPTHLDELDSHQLCWCNLTQHRVGPDQGQVNPRICSPGRECYQPR